jgi:hypothetical protein
VNDLLQGIHNKMAPAQIGGRGWGVVGSLNGGEISAKRYQEMAQSRIGCGVQLSRRRSLE